MPPRLPLILSLSKDAGWSCNLHPVALRAGPGIYQGFT